MDMRLVPKDRDAERLSTLSIEGHEYKADKDGTFQVPAEHVIKHLDELESGHGLIPQRNVAEAKSEAKEAARK